MLFSFFLVCAIALAISTVLLVAAGSRVRLASRVGGVILAAAVYFTAGWCAAELWNLAAAPTEAAAVFCFAITVGVVVARPTWNPFGHSTGRGAAERKPRS